MNQPFNRLTDAEAERLALLLNALGNATKAVSKILLHGYESYHPLRQDSNNRLDLEKEMGGVLGAFSLMTVTDDLDCEMVERFSKTKIKTALSYAHHQPSAVEDKKPSVEERSTRLTTDPADPRLGHGVDGGPAPQNEVYLVLSDEERAKGFIRPLRRTYIHKNCGTSTTMGIEIAETYARNPRFYGATYCVHCAQHSDLSEFTWEDGSVVGS